MLTYDKSRRLRMGGSFDTMIRVYVEKGDCV